MRRSGRLSARLATRSTGPRPGPASSRGSRRAARAARRRSGSARRRARARPSSSDRLGLQRDRVHDQPAARPAAGASSAGPGPGRRHRRRRPRPGAAARPAPRRAAVTTCRPGTPSRAALRRSVRPGPGCARRRSPGTGGRCAPTRCRSTRRPRPTSHSSWPGAGASRARAEARTSRLVSWPSCSYASSGSPASAERAALAGLGDALDRDEVQSRAPRPVRPVAARVRDAALVGAAQVAEHGQRSSPRTRRRPAASASCRAASRRPTDSTSSRRPGARCRRTRSQVRPTTGTTSDGLRRPAHPGAGQRHRRDGRVDPHRVRRRAGRPAWCRCRTRAGRRWPAPPTRRPAQPVQQARQPATQRDRPGHPLDRAAIGRHQVQVPPAADQHLGARRSAAAPPRPGPTQPPGRHPDDVQPRSRPPTLARPPPVVTAGRRAPTSCGGSATATRRGIRGKSGAVPPL